MIRSIEWKYILYEGFRAQLFNLQNDAEEYHDLAANAATKSTARDLHAALFDWLRQQRCRTEAPAEALFDLGPSVMRRLAL